MTVPCNESTSLHDRLLAIVCNDVWLMDALRAVRALKLPAWCIGAGVVRNRVWDALQQHATPSALADVDVAYFDTGDIDPGRDAALQARLHAVRPDIPWEVTNQAGVHGWFESHFGYAVPPLTSLVEAVGSWPEYATCVGVTLTDDDRIEIIAPYGLDDLFSMTIRRNPVRVSVETYRQRIGQKRYEERWAGVTVIAA